MAIEATSVIGPSRPRLVGDVLWLGFTAFVFAVILVIVCWSLSVELSAHNPPGVAAGKPTAGLTQPDALPTPAADIGEGSSNVAPPSPIATLSEQAGASLTPPDRSPQAAQAASAPAAVNSPGTHRLPQHKARARPVAPKEPPQLTPR